MSEYYFLFYLKVVGEGVKLVLGLLCKEIKFRIKCRFVLYIKILKLYF